MRKFGLLLVILLTAVCLTIPSPVAAQSASEQPVVQAVLFFSPTCPHCHTVIKEVLVPMVDDYGDQLQIIGVDTTQPDGGQLYQAAIEHYQIPPERRGVPTLIVGDTVLVGSGEIPAKFPTMVEELLAAGGIAWPDIPGFAPEVSVAEEQEASAEDEAVATPAETEAEPVSSTAATVEPTVAEQAPAPTSEPAVVAAPAPADEAPASEAEQAISGIDEESLSANPQAPPPDPVGIALASIVLAGMVIALFFAFWRVAQAQSMQLSENSSTYTKMWIIPILSLLGLGVSIYLAYVEISQVEAVCGPVGHCNIVQSSSYARIAGIPIAVLGILNYIAVIALWLSQRIVPLKNMPALALLGLTIFGTLFSIYLTLLEILVIRAVCAWCLSSAIITAVLMLLVVMPLTARPRLQRALSH